MAVPRIVEDLGLLLETNSLGTRGETIFYEAMPHTPDTLIYLHEGGGAEAENMPLREQIVQVMTRALLAEDAHDLAMQVHNLLHRMHHRQIGYHEVLACVGRLPQALPPDENGRVIYSMEFRLICRPLVSWSVTQPATPPVTGLIAFSLDGNGSVPITGAKASITATYSGTLTGWSLYGDAEGSVAVDVLKDGDSICGDSKPTLDDEQSAADDDLAGWQIGVGEGNEISFAIESISGLTYILLLLTTERG